MDAADLSDDPVAIGTLGGRFAMAPLVASVAELTETTRERLRELLMDFARRHLAEWNALVAEVRAGTVDQRARRVPGSAFRPDFHSRQAQEHFEAELWTESFSRFVNAGEVLLGQVFLPGLKAAGVAIETGKTRWFTTFEKWARDEGLALDASQEFQEFKRVYHLRSTRIAHGQHEATMAEALQAKKAYEGLRLLLCEMFGSRYGVTLEALQQRSLFARSMLVETADIDRLIALAEDAHRLVDASRSDLRRLMGDHVPRYPLAIREALDALSDADRQRADTALETAMREEFDLIPRMWSAATDGDRLLGDVIEEIADEKRESG